MPVVGRIMGCGRVGGTGGPNIGLLRRTLRHVGGQIIVLALVLLDLGSLGLALVSSDWLAIWTAVNLAVLVLWTLRSIDDETIQRQAEQEHKAHVRQQAEQGERLGRAEQQLREAEQGRREVEQELAAQKLKQLECLCRLEQQLMEVQRERREAGDELAALKQERSEQAERLNDTEQQLREADRRRREAEAELEIHKLQHAQQAERLRRVEQQLRAAERGRRRAEQEHEAHSQRQEQRVKAATQMQRDWWIVLGVSPSTSKDEIVRNYRRRIKQYHPDRVVGLAPEFTRLAEERTKALNQAYANAMRTRQ